MSEFMPHHSQLKRIYHGSPTVFDYFNFNFASPICDFGQRLYAFPDEDSVVDYVYAPTSHGSVALYTELSIPINLDIPGWSYIGDCDLLFLDVENNIDFMCTWVRTIVANSLGLTSEFSEYFEDVAECMLADIIYAPRADAQKHQIIRNLIDNYDDLKYVDQCRSLYEQLTPWHFTPQLVLSEYAVNQLCPNSWKEL